MIHYTCDFCGNPIQREELRFEVRIEVRVAVDSLEDAACPPELLDEETSDILDSADPAALPGNDLFRVFRFDLCPSCHSAFLRNPLPRAGRPGLRHFDN